MVPFSASLPATVGASILCPAQHTSAACQSRYAHFARPNSQLPGVGQLGRYHWEASAHATLPGVSQKIPKLLGTANKDNKVDKRDTWIEAGTSLFHPTVVVGAILAVAGILWQPRAGPQRGHACDGRCQPTR